MALDSGLTNGISQLPPNVRSVLNAALNSRSIEGAPVLNSLKCLVLDMGMREGS